jgi:hypothetical protein
MGLLASRLALIALVLAAAAAAAADSNPALQDSSNVEELTSEADLSALQAHEVAVVGYFSAREGDVFAAFLERERPTLFPIQPCVL